MHPYEDPRCPYCQEFETTGGGPHRRQAMLGGRARAGCALAFFLGGRGGGDGWKKAVNALRAALEEGGFVEYHEVLYANQPEESVDGCAGTYLRQLAGTVKGLRSPSFDAAVTSVKYRAFVTASRKACERAGGPRILTAPVHPPW
ncbi:thioredoxin domain-containing protein [Streptomyces sp. CC219B]|uniref:DsbA family protein n=1 Tax=Streptomyces sp. CC219B TaxID=3044574 RepID=UPI0024A97D06|nr:thioredoxin domain-containing protein [Streptomyces sp. CC219B]